MTNSASGHPAMWKLLHAIPYLKGWHDISTGYTAEDYVGKAPMRAPGPVDERWREWIGRWDEKWQIREENGQPVAGIEDGALLRLQPAAVPAKSYDSERKSIDLVVDGLEVMLRLGFDGEKRIVELCNGATGGRPTLQSVE